MKLNFATILAVLGGLGVFAPDVAAFATWLASMHIGWLSYVVRGLGLLAAFFAAAPLVVPRLRAFLALLGLATPPGALAPWDPKRGEAPLQSLGALQAANPGVTVVKSRPSSAGPLAVLLLGSLLASTAWAQDVPPVPQLGFKIGLWTTCQPATAGGVQINLKTGNWSRFVFAQGFGCTYRGWSQPVGAAAYIGYGVAVDAPNAYQGALLFSYADVVAGGPGLELFKDPTDQKYVEQVTLSLVGNFNWGASVSRLGTVERNAKLQGEADGMLKERASAGAK
jgi:hypothetical protein